MDKDYLIQITKELYRLTLLFPKKEPLRYKMREVADEILAHSLQHNQNQHPASLTQHPVLIKQELEILDSFFEVAKSQNWVSMNEILNLQKEYSKLKEEALKSQPEEETLPLQLSPQKKETPSELNERQKRILELLKEREKLQVWQVKQIFPQVSKRTLRRDFTDLLKKGLVERLGQRNQIFYQLKG